MSESWDLMAESRLARSVTVYTTAGDLLADVTELEEILEEAPHLPGMKAHLDIVSLHLAEALDILQKSRQVVELAKLATATQLERKRTL